MANGYSHHQNVHRSSFLPMLCSRPSIKDVHLPKWEDRSSSFSDDPSSPRVSCVGQVKRHNKVTGCYPTSHRFTTPKSTNHNNVKYFKLKKIFSSKNLIAAGATTTTITSSRSCRRGMIVDSARGPKYNDENDHHHHHHHHHYVPISMDPPLPVNKRVQQASEGRDEVNLWKRRSGGMALKSIQIRQIQIPNNHFLEPSTV